MTVMAVSMTIRTTLWGELFWARLIVYPKKMTNMSFNSRLMLRSENQKPPWQLENIFHFLYKWTDITQTKIQLCNQLNYSIVWIHSLAKAFMWRASVERNRILKFVMGTSVWAQMKLTTWTLQPLHSSLACASSPPFCVWEQTSPWMGALKGNTQDQPRPPSPAQISAFSRGTGLQRNSLHTQRILRLYITYF